eukprot:TRINITY_DN892_c0_g1_i4.p5 TRINITY_DN892_c0_g1~~TRINITY_DN892_c0_g1_i4.p5  ORF type:complete len:61 (+),score=7.20 TRINITY_DN892_c0_g1_i4:497-679(+)
MHGMIPRKVSSWFSLESQFPTKRLYSFATILQMIIVFCISSPPPEREDNGYKKDSEELIE